ncbi:MAG: MOSC domain-containing protein [Dehalococcoidia bacterium]
MKDTPQVAAIHISRAHFEEMEHLESARVIDDLGIEGDRYAAKRGINRSKRQVLLMDRETLEELGLSPGTVRENITTSGLDIYSLAPGQRVGIGSQVILEVTEACNPCERMDAIRPGLQAQLQGRRGMMTRVVRGGEFSVGDPVKVL